MKKFSLIVVLSLVVTCLIIVVPQQICAEEPPDCDVDDYMFYDFNDSTDGSTDDLMDGDSTGNCVLPTHPATGAVHAQPNRLKAHGGWNKKRPKKKKIRLDGYISNKLAALKGGCPEEEGCPEGGDGIISAEIQIWVEGEDGSFNYEKTKILRGTRPKDGKWINKILEDGSFKVRVPFVRRRGTVYIVKLFAKSCDGDGLDLVDETYVKVHGKKKKGKKK